MKKRETNLYNRLKKHFVNAGWFFLRIEAATIPDIFVSKGEVFFWIECKICRKKELKNPFLDCTWELGQRPFAMRLMRRSPKNYLFIVEHNKQILCFRPVDGKFERLELQKIT